MASVRRVAVCGASSWLAFAPRLVVALALEGCMAGSGVGPSTPERPPPAPLAVSSPARYEARAGVARKDDDTKDGGLEDLCKIDPSACATVDFQSSKREVKAELYAVQQVMGAGPTFGGGDVPAAPAPTPPAPIETATRPDSSASRAAAKPAVAEMRDVEARVELEVDGVAAARGRVHALAVAVGGQIVNEIVEDKPATAGAAVSLRVPAAQLDVVLSRLAGLGKLVSRKVETTDVGRKHHDASILVANLEATLRRYEQLLARTENAREVLEVEGQLARVRTELDRVRGDVAWMRDRAARATVYVTLAATRPDAERIAPSAAFHPGVRGMALADLSDAAGTRGFAGAGISLLFLRRLALDATWATGTHEGDGLDLFLAMGGGDLFSDRLGGGKRRAFNPYLGARIGYARLLDENALALAAVVGVELLKTELGLLDLQGRAYAFVGLPDGAHAAVEPALNVHLAY